MTSSPPPADLPRGPRMSGSDSEEEKELSLTEYDRRRKRCAPLDSVEIQMNTRILSTELTCPICLDLLTNTMTTKECLHRFCQDCITTALLRGNKECPTCRKKLVSKRSLRLDTNFDDLIRKIWPDRHKYEEMVFNADQGPAEDVPPVFFFNSQPSSQQQLMPIPMQTADKVDLSMLDNDAPTPPALLSNAALLDSRRTTSPMEDEGETNGRSTPVWFHYGDIREEELDETEKKMLKEAKDAYNLLKQKRQAAARSGSADSVCFTTSSSSSQSKGDSSRESSGTPPALLNNGSASAVKTEGAFHDCPPSSSKAAMPVCFPAKMLMGVRDTNISEDSSADSMEEESAEEDETEIDGEKDRDEIDELEMMDDDLVAVFTSPPPSPDALLTGGGAFKTRSKSAFDPRHNPAPPFPEQQEMHAELNPVGKGATWNYNNGDIPQPDQGMEEDDEEVVYDEDDIISAVDIDDILNEIEIDVVENVPPNKGEQLPKQESDEEMEDEPAKKKDVKEYLEEETKQDLEDLNELRIGGYTHMKAALDDGEQFDMAETVQWYTQLRNGEEFIYYERAKMPVSKGKRKESDIFDEEEETRRVKKKVSLKDILCDMSDSDSFHSEETMTSSLLSSAASTMPTVSAAEEDTEDASTLTARKDEKPEAGKENAPSGASSSTAAEVRPPHAMCPTKERLHRWLADAPAHPLTPDDDHLERKFQTDDDAAEENNDSPPDNYEIETEMRPSAALLSRHVPREVMNTRYIRAHHNTSMELISEYLYQRWLEEVHNRRTHEIAPDVPRPEYFYVFNRGERHCKCILLHESLAIAQAVTSRDDHVVIYFDTERANLTSKEMSLLEKIVPARDMLDLQSAPCSSRTSTGSTNSTH